MPEPESPQPQPDPEPQAATPLEAASPAEAAAPAAAAPIEAAATPEPEPPLAPTLQLDRKHPLALRWMHWINFPVLYLMVWSGILIYWADSVPPNGDYPSNVYRIGIGHWTLIRLFPDSFYNHINATFGLTRGLGWHFLFMWFFAINGLLYVLYLIFSGEWRLLVPDRRSLRDAILVTLHDLHLHRGLPPQKKYNGAQRIAYTLVILMGFGSLMTGLAIYKPAQLHWITQLCGGYEMARWLHFWLMMGFCGFFLIHIVQVVLAGWNNFRAMVSGYEIKPAAEPSLEAERRHR